MDARFWKTWYRRFDPFACPPWDLSRAHPRSGLVAQPPHPRSLSSRVLLIPAHMVVAAVRSG